MNVEPPPRHHHPTVTTSKDLCEDLFPQTTPIQPMEHVKKLCFTKKINIYDCGRTLAIVMSIIKLSASSHNATWTNIKYGFELLLGQTRVPCRVQAVEEMRDSR